MSDKHGVTFHTDTDVPAGAAMIVAAVDGSPASDAAVAWAAAAAEARGVPLRLASSYTIPQFLYAEGMVPPEELFAELKQETLGRVTAAQQIAQRTAPGVEIIRTLGEGSPIDMLLELSKTAEMVVMGSRGLGGLQTMVLGSVSAAVVSHAQCPVVVIREDTEVPESGPIVVGVDGSDVSQQAVMSAFQQASERGCDIAAVHTWMDVQVKASAAGLAGGAWDQIETDQHAVLEQRLEQARAAFPGVTVATIVTRDRPVEALAAAAQGAQLLVVGSHGRGGFRGMLLGSTSRALLAAAPCPLMVVRPGSVPSST